MPALQRILYQHISPELLFLMGILSMPPFLFSESLEARAFLTCFYLLCAHTSGKRLKLAPNLLAFILVTATNLVTPLGKILFQLGHFPVTLGALQLGIRKALTLIGMIALARFTLRTNLQVPGRFGSILSLMFFYFEKITERKFSLRKGHLLEDIQALIQNVYREGEHIPSPQARILTSRTGYLFLLCFLAVSWGTVFVH
jgi:energy-coupling factor transporter transmembrane protein EcfT